MTRHTARLAIAVIVLVGGCASQPRDARVRERAMLRSAELEDGGFPEAAAALADGELSDEEYASLAVAFRRCAAAASAQYEDPVPNPANPRVLIWDPIAPDADDRPALTTCERRYLSVEELLWEDPGPMDPALLAATRDCLAALGIELSESARTLADFVPASVADQRTAMGCISNAVGELFPSIGVLGLAPPSIE